MAYAPDKDDPYPKPKPKPKPGGNNGSGGLNNISMPAFMPGQLGALASQLSHVSGSTGAWKDDLRDMTAPMHMSLGNRGGGNGGNNGHNGGGNHNNGGGKDPATPVDTGGGFDPSSPRSRMAPMGMMPRGFLQAGQPMTQAPPAGIFAARSPMQQQAPQLQLPPEIQAMMRARQMGR